MVTPSIRACPEHAVSEEGVKGMISTKNQSFSENESIEIVRQEIQHKINGTYTHSSLNEGYLYTCYQVAKAGLSYLQKYPELTQPIYKMQFYLSHIDLIWEAAHIYSLSKEIGKRIDQYVRQASFPNGEVDLNLSLRCLLSRSILKKNFNSTQEELEFQLCHVVKGSEVLISLDQDQLNEIANLDDEDHYQVTAVDTRTGLQQVFSYDKDDLTFREDLLKLKGSLSVGQWGEQFLNELRTQVNQDQADLKRKALIFKIGAAVAAVALGALPFLILNKTSWFKPSVAPLNEVLKRLSPDVASKLSLNWEEPAQAKSAISNLPLSLVTRQALTVAQLGLTLIGAIITPSAWKQHTINLASQIFQLFRLFQLRCLKVEEVIDGPLKDVASRSVTGYRFPEAEETLTHAKAISFHLLPHVNQLSSSWVQSVREYTQKAIECLKWRQINIIREGVNKFLATYIPLTTEGLSASLLLSKLSVNGTLDFSYLP